MTIQVILVPAGAEYQAVMRGLKTVPEAAPVISIPAGPNAFRAWLQNWADRSRFANQEVLLIGLGGSLSPQRSIGDAILLRQVWDDAGGDGAQSYQSDRALTEVLAQRLGAPVGTGVMCDRVITTVAEKRRLGDRYQADVVDMESAVLLDMMPEAKVSILRLISDDCGHDLPDISRAIAPDGSLRAGTLAQSFLKRPVAALNFISGSLQGLKAIEQVTLALFNPEQ
jgi:hypothetical protein